MKHRCLEDGDMRLHNHPHPRNPILSTWLAMMGFGNWNLGFERNEEMEATFADAVVDALELRSCTIGLDLNVDEKLNFGSFYISTAESLSAFSYFVCCWQRRRSNGFHDMSREGFVRCCLHLFPFIFSFGVHWRLDRCSTFIIIALNAANRPNWANAGSRLNSNRCCGRTTHTHSTQRCKCMHINNTFAPGVSPGHVLD